MMAATKGKGFEMAKRDEKGLLDISMLVKL